MTKHDLKAKAVDLGATHIAQAIKAWDKKSADDLIEMLQALDEFCDENDCRADEYVDLASLPSADIPTDVDTLYPVWAMDADENLIVGRCISEFGTMTLADYREEKAA